MENEAYKEIFLSPRQQKLQSFKWKVGGKVRKKQKHLL